MEEKWEAERQQLQEEIVQLRSDINWKDRELEASRGEGVGASSSAESEITQLKAELDHAKETIRELQSTHGELEGQSPGVDVEASLRLEAMVREKTTALQYAVDESLQLQTTIREKESALWEKETALVKSESRAEGLQEQVKALRSPLQTDPRRRVELRLNEEIGKRKKAETELRLLKEVRGVCVSIFWAGVYTVRVQSSCNNCTQGGGGEWNLGTRLHVRGVHVFRRARKQGGGGRISKEGTVN